MCFYHDYDWSAEVHVQTEGGADIKLTCDECGGEIPKGEWRRHIFQQEHEECYRCSGNDWEPCACPKDDGGSCLGCECDEPDYGETYEYVCCGPCANLLEAIEAVEIDNGCSGAETQPSYGRLYDAMTDHKPDGHAYAERAVRMFPALRSHQFVAEALEVD